MSTGGPPRALVLLIVAACAWAGPARAQAPTSDETGSAAEDEPTPASEGGSEDEEARSLFEAGRTAMEAGRHERALAYFRESYALSARPELLFNIGVAADRLRRDREALEAFEQYLAEVPEAPNRADVEARVETLRLAVATSPGAVAAASEGTAEAPLDAPEARPLYASPWLWTAVGTVLVATVITAVAVSGGGGRDPIPGEGGVIATLRHR